MEQKTEMFEHIPPTEAELEEILREARDGHLLGRFAVLLVAEIRRLRALCGEALGRVPHTLTCNTITSAGGQCVCGAAELKERLAEAAKGEV